MQAAINVFRDALLPFLLIICLKNKDKVLLILSIAVYLYFATFNLAKSFIIINSVALILACAVRVSVGFYFKLASLIFSSSFVMGYLTRSFDGIAGFTDFLVDFVVRRILTLTPNLGVNVREMVNLYGFYWESADISPFEMQLYKFIGHSDLASGWANVYLMADAYGRGGMLGICLAITIFGGYILWFNFISKYLGSIYSIYLVNLFSIYIFMQGVFSFGLIASFVVGPFLLLVYSGAIKFADPA